MKKHTRCLIIGSGPAGYTAAIYAQRAMLSPILFLGAQPGGQLMITTEVENFPGFSKAIQGPWLMEQMFEQCKNLDVQMINDVITNVDLSQKPFTCESDTNGKFTADTIIISTGAQAKWLGLASEAEFKGYGVSACATCDGFFFKDKVVCVVGGGNTAVEEALFLTHYAKKVYLIHRGNKLKAEKMNQDTLLKCPKIEVLWNHELKEIIGETNPSKHIKQVKLINNITHEERLLDMSGVFIAIGHSPATSLFKNQLKMDEYGYIHTKSCNTETSIPGVFAAGDVQDKVYRQAVTAAGQGCMAALDAEKYLQNHQ